MLPTKVPLRADADWRCADLSAERRWLSSFVGFAAATTSPRGMCARDICMRAAALDRARVAPLGRCHVAARPRDRVSAVHGRRRGQGSREASAPKELLHLRGRGLSRRRQGGNDRSWGGFARKHSRIRTMTDRNSGNRGRCIHGRGRTSPRGPTGVQSSRTGSVLGFRQPDSAPSSGAWISPSYFQRPVLDRLNFAPEQAPLRSWGLSRKGAAR